jgi:hypothetical protein
MHASERTCAVGQVDCTAAYGRSDGLTEDETPDMWEVFGDLGPDDSYFVPFSGEVNFGYSGARRWNTRPTTDCPTCPEAGRMSARSFAHNSLQGVSTFITVATHDTVVTTQAIPYSFDAFITPSDARYSPDFAALVASVDNPFPGPSPATMWVEHVGGSVNYVVMPTYDSGHTVTLRAPAAAKLKADVALWLARGYVH